MLFNWEQPKDIPKEISTNALKAAINFVDVCIQHSAGKILYLSALLVQTKFRGKGNKAGAIAGWSLLQDLRWRMF